MAWIESHQELRDHPKRKRLSRLLDISRRETIGLLHELWWWAYDYAAEGDLSSFSDDDIADAIDWESDPGALVVALTESGFINEDRHLHDWEDFAQKWIERRQADRERKRAKRQKPEPVHQMSNGHPAEIPSLSGVTGPNRTGPNRTGPDATSPQPPPPQAEEGERPKRRGRRRDEQPVAVATPVTIADEQLWEATRDQAGGFMAPGIFAGLVSPLVPIGRASDGGLMLRAPPGVVADAQRMVTHVVSRVLQEVGDEAGSRAKIVG